MAFADISPRTLLVGEGEARITLTQAVETGDLVGINATNGWVLAKGAATAVKALFVAAEPGAVGSKITVFRRALVRAAYDAAAGEIGDPLYLSNTAGSVGLSVGSVTQVVGYVMSTTDIALEIRSPLALDASDIANDSVDSAHIVDGAVDPVHLAVMASGRIIVGGTDTIPAAVAVSGDATLAYTGALTLDSDHTKGVIAVGPLLQVDALNFTVYLPCKCTVNQVRSFLTVIITTANSVVVVKNHAGSTAGTLTITQASCAVGDEDTTGALSSNNTFAAGEKLTLAIDGGAAAGEAVFFIEYTRTA